jgi:hypothetical protein
VSTYVTVINNLLPQDAGAMENLLRQDKTLYGALSPHIKLKLEKTSEDVS